MELEIEDALLWLARSGGSLSFASAGMAGAAPAHANAGYRVEAKAPSADGSVVSASGFTGSYQARTVGLSPSVSRVVAELKSKGAAPATLAMARPSVMAARGTTVQKPSRAA